MIRKVLYVAHPVRPTNEEVDVIQPYIHHRTAKIWKPHATRLTEAAVANINGAMTWLRWLCRSFPETTFIAPWIASMLSGEDDADPVQREAGLVGDCAVIERCDGIVLCGPRISEGMRREMEHGLARDEEDRVPFQVYDLTRPAIRNNIMYPTWSVVSGMLFVDWFRSIDDGGELEGLGR